MEQLRAVEKGLPSQFFLSIVLCLTIITGASDAHGFQITHSAGAKDVTGAVSEITLYKDALYLGTLDRGVAIFDPGSRRVTRFKKNEELPSKRVESMAVLGDSLYIGTEMGLAVYDGSIAEVVRSVGNVTMRKTYVGADALSKDVYAASLYLAGGLVRNDGSGWRFIGGGGRGLFNDINSFAFSGDRAFFGSIRGALFTYDGKVIEKATDEFFPSNIFSLGILDGTVYVGTGRGLYAVDGKKWKPVRLGEGLDSAAVFDMHRGDGYLLLATTEGLVRFKKGKIDVITMSEGLPSKRVNAVFEQDGVVYAGTPVGLVVIEGW